MLIYKILRYKHTVNLLKFSNIAALNPRERLLKLKEMAPKHRDNPVIKQLDTPEFKTIFSEELMTLASYFKESGYEIRVAGGAVRDLLLGLTPKDLDFATTATPQQMKDMFTEQNVRMINEKGEKHGTITARINEKQNFEVTTLRIDVTTDGRHAEVQYTTDWLLDANRRDLTINSMFLGLDGSVYDYFYGYDDLQKRRVVFVGDAVTRIQEDFLRILRYFRFYGRISTTPNDHDEVTLTAIRENASGLAKISGERIWTEVKKILEGNYAGELMLRILECNIANYIGLPENCNTDELKTIWKQSKHLKMNAITLLSSLINTPEEALTLHARLKLSVFERDLLLFIVEHRERKIHEKPLHPYKLLVLKGKSKFTRQWVIELLKYINSPHLSEMEEWEMPKFPVHGEELKKHGIYGKTMGVVMGELKMYWAEHDFNLSAEVILEQLPNVISKLKENVKK